MVRDFWAHTPDTAEGVPEHLLKDHLQSVARRAVQNALDFSVPNLEPLLQVAGLLHDLGKYKLKRPNYDSETNRHTNRQHEKTSPTERTYSVRHQNKKGLFMLWNGKDYWAHTSSEGSDGKPHDLHQHLIDTAARAQEYAKVFGAGNFAYLLGVWHDLGKYNPDFQEYLREAQKAADEGREFSRKGPPHAIWGAMLLREKLRNHPQIDTFMLPILGHHAGLEDASEGGQKIDAAPDLSDRLKLMEQVIKQFKLFPIDNLEHVPTAPHKQELFTRMVTSALVDADFLDTERHFGQKQPQAREHDLNISTLWGRFETGRERLLKKQIEACKVSSRYVQEVRDEVYNACLDKASGEPGVYQLTVPTGGGKTLSSLAFALKHAKENDLRRVIVAIPYTSIIDQNTRVYRDVLGTDAVLEHHSAVQPNNNEAEQQDLYTLRLRLATENWDVPLICTTFVQLFESLFARKTGKLRKLHRIADSVIVLDEVQTLPLDLRGPTLDVLRTLVDDYGVSLVLCTATQPAFETDELTESFKNISQTEIVPQYYEHFEKLARVEYIKHEQYPHSVPWETLAEEIKDEPRVLAIFNTRKDALALLRELQKQNVTDLYHLSTLMCGAHRKDKLDEINARLADKGQPPVRLISTQVVEAGVDLDFPIVYRALAPLDRIVQAAGRCNRNGNSSELGRVVIFQTESGKAPKGAYQKGIEKARTIIEMAKDIDKELNGPDILRLYFSRLYQDVEPDDFDIQPMRQELEFKRVAKAYRMIREETVSVIVPYRDYSRHLEQWERFPSRKSWRALQPYIVNIYAYEAKKLLDLAMIRDLVERSESSMSQVDSNPENFSKSKNVEGKIYFFQREDKYDLVTGLPIDRDPADLIYLENSML